LRNYRFQPASGPPVVAQINDHAARLTGIPASRLFSDGRLFAVVQVLVAEYYRVEPALNYDRYNLEAEALGATIIFHPDALPDLDTRRPLLADKADLHKLRLPDPQRPGVFHSCSKRTASSPR